MLDFPDDTQPIFLSTEASKIGLGGILYQEIHGVKRILYYHSELLSSSQNRFHSIELEALTIFKCITRMKSFLLGFRRDKSSSVQFIGAMVNRSKVRAASTHVSPYSLQRPQFSSAVSSSSTPATISSSSPIEEFDITQLQQHQNNDIQIQKLLMI
ncbi:unnamed protein product [Rotaria magnacalcarata]|uniref:Reverse transcriptase/retrotransposon-derived protein RNase H-like domain-containing protein n=1 Tax=Rotaria magnacalcarata TaxID=392030 RepID=A0A816YYB6_9BILA|nr:unnamed protein product [Rotaria magnacalcarata]